MRPAPKPSRSARKESSSGPVRLQSDGSTASLLLTPVILQTGDGSLSSASVTPTVTSSESMLAADERRPVLDEHRARATARLLDGNQKTTIVRADVVLRD